MPAHGLGVYIMTIEQLSIFIENKPGKLVEALETLADNDIDMRALSLADTADFGILRIIVDKPAQTQEKMKEAGFLVRTTEVIAVVVSDKPGGLAAILRILADKGIDVEYTYAFVAHSRDSAYVILRVGDNDTAVKALQEKGVTLVKASDLYNL